MSGSEKPDFLVPTYTPYNEKRNEGFFRRVGESLRLSEHSVLTTTRKRAIQLQHETETEQITTDRFRSQQMASGDIQRMRVKLGQVQERSRPLDSLIVPSWRYVNKCDCHLVYKFQCPTFIASQAPRPMYRSLQLHNVRTRLTASAPRPPKSGKRRSGISSRNSARSPLGRSSSKTTPSPAPTRIGRQSSKK